MNAFRILIIDDDPDQADILKTALGAYGREVKTCIGGKAALELLNRECFDLIFTDISMPEVDGIQIIKYVKEHCGDTEIVPITAFGDWGLYAQALRMGVKDFINKPFNIPEIQGIIEKASASEKQS